MAYLATVAAFGFDDTNPCSLLPVYRSLGCRASQFYRNVNNPPKPSEARRIAEDAGVPFDSVHGIFGIMQDPSCPDETIRKSTVETYRREAQLAVQLGGPKVVVHPGPPAEYETHITPKSRAARVDPIRKSMNEMARIGEELGVVYLFENIPANYHFGSDPVQLGQLIRELDHPNVRMCLDTGHANMTCNTVAALDACADVITYLHVHDNHGKLDNHRFPGDGTIDWPVLGQRLKTLDPNLPAMLEFFFKEKEIVAEVDNGLGERLAGWLPI